MDENDFMVAIQGILVRATEAGWSVEKAIEKAQEAIEEFLETMEEMGAIVGDHADDDDDE